MIDELRFVDVDLFGGQNPITPTSVPYDSNLTLVLPGSGIADERFEIQSSKTNLLGDRYNFLKNGGSTERFYATAQNPNAKNGYIGSHSFLTHKDYPEWMTYREGAYSVSAMDNAVVFERTGNPASDFPEAADAVYWGVGFLLTTANNSGLKLDTDYTFSFVRTNGKVESFTFNTGHTYFLQDKYYWKSNSGATIISSKTTDWGKFQYSSQNWEYDKNSSTGSANFVPVVSIIPKSGYPVDVVYIELVEGTSTDLKMVKHTDVYDSTTIESNTAAIQTAIPVKGYTVGGVRPSTPQKGDLWFPVMDNRITSVQIYTGSMWQEVNARWFTGTRWIPIYAFDITTLEDLFDIADAEGVVVPLPDQNAFLRWWQLQWLDFRQWLENALSNIGSGGGTSLPDDEAFPGEEATEEEDGWSFIDLIVKTKDGIWKITKGIVKTAAGGITGLVMLIGDAGDFFEPFQDGYSEGVGDLMDFNSFGYGGEGIWD